MFEAPDLNLVEPTQGYSGYNVNGFSKTPSSSSYSSMPSIGLYASMGLSILGTITTTMQQASAARAQGAYESSIANTNARIARIQARQTIEAGDVMASRKNVETGSIVSSIRAQQGASGIDVGSGSSALVRAGVSAVGAVDELTIRNNAARQAWGYETEAIGDSYKGEYAKLTAKSKETQSILNGGLQAISGPLAIESNYLRWSRYMGGGAGQRLPFDLSTN